MKNPEEIIKDAPLSRRALFKGMQFTGLVGLASIVVACMAPPISLAVAGAGVALFAASFAGQVVFLNQEAKRQAEEGRRYSPKTNRGSSKTSHAMTQEKTAQVSAQKQASKAPGVKRVTPSVRFSAEELIKLQRGRGPREI